VNPTTPLEALGRISFESFEGRPTAMVKFAKSELWAAVPLPSYELIVPISWNEFWRGVRTIVTYAWSEIAARDVARGFVQAMADSYTTNQPFALVERNVLPDPDACRAAQYHPGMGLGEIVDTFERWDCRCDECVEDLLDVLKIKARN